MQNRLLGRWVLLMVFTSGAAGCPEPLEPTQDMPAKVKGLVALSAYSQVELGWDVEAKATSYNLYWAKSSGVSTTSQRIQGATRNYIHTGLTNGTPYFYRVAAVNQAVEGELSDEVSSTPGWANRIRYEFSTTGLVAGDQYGTALAANGNLLAISAPLANGTAADQGAVFVYERQTDGTLGAGTKLVALDPATNDRFGSALALDGDYLVVGAWMEDGGTGDPLLDAGAAYVFKRVGPGLWDSGFKLPAPSDLKSKDGYGTSVAISGDTVAVGSILGDGGGTPPVADTGAVLIYSRSGTNTWSAPVKVVHPKSDAQDGFGIVALDGNTLAVGSPFEDGGDGNPLLDAGAVFVFFRSGGTFGSPSTIRPVNTHAKQWFGGSLSLQGNELVVGGPADQGDVASLVVGAGAIFLFNRTGDPNGWSPGSKITEPEPQTNNAFGWSVNLQGDLLVVGTPNRDSTGVGTAMPDSGVAYLFLRQTGSWKQPIQLTASNPAEKDTFGYGRAAIGDGFIAITAPGRNQKTGAAFMF